MQPETKTASVHFKVPLCWYLISLSACLRTPLPGSCFHLSLLQLPWWSPVVSDLSSTRSVLYPQQHFIFHTTHSFSSSWLPGHQILLVFLLPSRILFLSLSWWLLNFYSYWPPLNFYFYVSDGILQGLALRSLLTNILATDLKYCLRADDPKLISPVSHSQNTILEYATASNFPWIPHYLKCANPSYVQPPPMWNPLPLIIIPQTCFPSSVLYLFHSHFLDQMPLSFLLSLFHPNPAFSKLFLLPLTPTI